MFEQYGKTLLLDEAPNGEHGWAFGWLAKARMERGRIDAVVEHAQIELGVNSELRLDPRTVRFADRHDERRRVSSGRAPTRRARRPAPCDRVRR